MQWRDPSLLVALLLPVLVAAWLAWGARRRTRDLARFVESPLWAVVVPGRDAGRHRIRGLLQTAAIAALVLALAGPMWGFRWQEVRSEGVDLVIALDTSRSMLATDVKPNRIERAKLAIQDLLLELRGDRVALVPFAGSAFVQSPLTLDRGAFRENLDAVDVGIIPRGGTNLAAAIDASLDAFEGRQGNHQAVVLITDGESHEGTIDEAIERAKQRGVRVFTVGIGTPDGELIPLESGYVKDRRGNVVKSRLDEEILQRVALATGGVYLHAAGVDLGLTDLYRDHVASMEKRKLESTMERRYEHRFAIPLLLATLLLAIDLVIGETRGRTSSRRGPEEPA
jgi:Ca-activated chloride channel family protein